MCVCVCVCMYIYAFTKQYVHLYLLIHREWLNTIHILRCNGRKHLHM